MPGADSREDPVLRIPRFRAGETTLQPGAQAAKVPGPSDLPAEYPSDRAAESRSLVGEKNVPYRRHEEYFNLKH